MRRFAQGVGKRKVPWANIAYFTIAWNLLGIVIYKTLDQRQKNKEEDWANKTSTQKYVSMMMKDKTPVRVVSIDGATVDAQESTVGDYTAPK